MAFNDTIDYFIENTFNYPLSRSATEWPALTATINSRLTRKTRYAENSRCRQVCIGDHLIHSVRGAVCRLQRKGYLASRPAGSAEFSPHSVLGPRKPFQKKRA